MKEPIKTKKLLVKAMYENGFLSFGRYQLTHGAIAPVYVDCRRLQSYPAIWRLALTLYKAAFDQFTFDKLCGVPMGTIPTVAAAGVQYNLPSVFVRDQRKGYGLGKFIEGDFTPGERLLMVEDVISTGGSVLKACLKAQAEGAKIAGVVCLFDAELGGVENLRALGIDVEVIFSFATFLTMLSDFAIEPNEQAAIKKAHLDTQLKLPLPENLAERYMQNSSRCGGLPV